mmetsp:Transcript_63058/g.169015  ORF Transcript_63058/g.169015 Transcript_63058/m.169015 type:complete len:149 (-) Transcript_63058:141-587(-)
MWPPGGVSMVFSKSNFNPIPEPEAHRNAGGAFGALNVQMPQVVAGMNQDQMQQMQQMLPQMMGSPMFAQMQKAQMLQMQQMMQPQMAGASGLAEMQQAQMQQMQPMMLMMQQQQASGGQPGAQGQALPAQVVGTGQPMLVEATVVEEP